MFPLQDETRRYRIRNTTNLFFNIFEAFFLFTSEIYFPFIFFKFLVILPSIRESLRGKIQGEGRGESKAGEFWGYQFGLSLKVDKCTLPPLATTRL